MLRYQKIITKFCLIFLLMGGNFAWALTTSAHCTPYHYFGSSSACASLKSQASASMTNPEIMKIHKDYKAKLAAFLGAATSLQEAFPRLSHVMQQNHLEFPAWQLIIDRSLHHIFHLKSLKNENYLCKGLPQEPVQLGLQLGISISLAHQIHEKCKEINPNGSGEYFGNQVNTKFYIFVKLDQKLIEDKNFPFTGWTDAANTTYLFIRPSTTWGDLELALIHELAIGMDSKGLHGVAQFTLAYPTASVPIGSKIEEEWPPLFNMNRLPEIQYALAAMRANRIMQMAFDEINQKESNSEARANDSNFVTSIFSVLFSSKDSELKNETKESLIKEFRNFVEQAKTWELPKTLSDSPMNVLQQTSLTEIKNMFPKIKTLEDVINAIVESKEKILLYSGGPEVDFLTYMSTPLFGKKSNQTFLSNGPGCGYCGGSNKKEDIEKWNNFWDQKIDPSSAQPSASEGEPYE